MFRVRTRKTFPYQVRGKADVPREGRPQAVREGAGDQGEEQEVNHEVGVREDGYRGQGGQSRGQRGMKEERLIKISRKIERIYI